MHEWALAEAVISTAVKLSIENNFKEIVKLKIKMGELQNIDSEILKFALERFMETQKSLFKKTKIRFATEKTVLLCNACGFKWGLVNEKLDVDEFEAIHFIPEVAHAYIRCPKCESCDFNVAKGRGIELSSIEGIK